MKIVLQAKQELTNYRYVCIGFSFKHAKYPLIVKKWQRLLH